MHFMGFGSYKTAWYMCHRIRAGLQDRDFQKLVGIVEVDEAFVGGKAKNRHRGKRGDDGRGGIGSGKTPVVGAISRMGNLSPASSQASMRTPSPDLSAKPCRRR